MQKLNVDRKKQSLYGFNVEGFNLEAKKIIERILQKYRPSVTLYSNDYAGAHKLYDIVEGESLIIHRTYQPNSVESAWENWTATNWKDFFKSNPSGPLYQTFLNNPIITNDPNRINEYIDFVIEVLRWAMENKYYLAFPLPDNNVTWETLMDKGSFDKLLLAYDDYGFRDFGHIGAVKEQIPFHLNLATALSRKRDGLENLSAQTLLKYEFMQRSYWPTYEEVNITDWKSNEYLYRSVWINKRMEQLGRKPIPTVVTEFNWGDHATFSKWTDKNNVPRNIQIEITDLYKINSAPYPLFSGIMSLKSLYENIFKLENKTVEKFEQTVFSQIEHMQKISPDNYLGMCWYTLDPGSALRDLRAGLSYQSLLENLEPLLYNMVNKLKEDITSKPTISPITVVKIENITDNSSLKKEVSVIKSLDTDVDTLQIIPAVKIETLNESIVIPPAVVDPNNAHVTATIPSVKSEQIILASNVITKPEITPVSVPTVKIENLKNINENIVTDKTSQITLKVDNTIGRVDNKDTISKDNQQSISLDKVVNDWRVYWVSSVGFQSNIRSKANVKSDAIGKVEQEETLYYVGKQLLEIDSLGYRWIPISDYSNEKKTNIDIKGWIREDAVRLRRYEFLYNLPVSIIVTVNNASADEVEWIKRKFNSGDIKVEIKVD